MTRKLEDYDPSKDTEHLQIWDGRMPANRGELIQWAGILANKTGKRVRINAMDIVPSKPVSAGERAFQGVVTLIIGIFVFTLVIGLIVAALAALAGQT